MLRTIHHQSNKQIFINAGVILYYMIAINYKQEHLLLVWSLVATNRYKQLSLRRVTKTVFLEF